MGGKDLKHAWSVPDIVMQVLAIISVLVFFVLWPLVGAKASIILVLVVFYITTGAFFVRKRDPASVCTDERERAIKAKATLVGGQVLFAACGLGPLALYYICMGRGDDVFQIKAHTLMWASGGMLLLYMVSSSITYVALWFGGIRHGKD